MSAPTHAWLAAWMPVPILCADMSGAALACCLTDPSAPPRPACAGVWPALQPHPQLIVPQLLCGVVPLRPPAHRRRCHPGAVLRGGPLGERLQLQGLPTGAAMGCGGHQAGLSWVVNPPSKLEGLVPLRPLRPGRFAP